MSAKHPCPQCDQPMRYAYGGSKKKETRWRELYCKCGFHYRGERWVIASTSPYTAFWQKIGALK